MAAPGLSLLATSRTCHSGLKHAAQSLPRKDTHDIIFHLLACNLLPIQVSQASMTRRIIFSSLIIIISMLILSRCSGHKTATLSTCERRITNIDTVYIACENNQIPSYQQAFSLRTISYLNLLHDFNHESQL